MKKQPVLALFLLFLSAAFTNAQRPSPVKQLFPPGTVFHENISYAGDTSRHHLLDIYLPANAKPGIPLVVWVHGGAWMLNDKYADMSYMKNTVKGFIDSGYALASIDYRYSTEAVFPAQLQDCNQTINFLYNHAEKYGFDKNNIALIGFSAGGHLASLLALAHNSNVPAFYADGKKPLFKIKAVLDFYGPSDFMVFAGADMDKDEPKPITRLLGALPIERPDIAKAASPVTYVDKNDPPFFIVQGEKDESVPYTQSVLLQSYLKLAGVENELTIVPGAPHYGPMFDAEEIRLKLFRFLRKHLR
ncbi:alpha/beta hydrolase [Foetidibacter luteolus]|uniref:alpha/beta hydrolase n=1 Tax=Foetidibacter luteolus TaxID=2608880 RepID=UPI00129A400B|nr:alpha/beta hydrolase [Foetidibacter luteolus]